MTFQATVYRVLIASPSDVTNERKAIPEVIYSWNSIHSSRFGVVLQPVMWETHATPEMGDRPQEIINKQLVKDCDILIGAFWTKLGTSTGKAESGTVEEIEEFIKTEKSILLYFSSAPVALKSVDQDQYNRLVQFKEKCKKGGLISEYESVGELREQLQRHLTSTLSRIHQPSDEIVGRGQSVDVDPSKSALMAYKVQYESFLRRLEAEWASERDSGPRSTDEGKLILRQALSEVLELSSQIQDERGTNLRQILEEVAKRLRAHQRFQTYMDGGVSFKAFWKEGDDMIQLLKHVPAEINKALQ